MKALIFNSGLGSRMKHLTENNPKCLVKLYNGETILERQLRILNNVGIKDIIITTGPYKDLVVNATKSFKDMNFTFVENNDYLNTNYIVSMNNAYDVLDDDFLLLHGDLVFNERLVRKMLESKEKSLCLYNKEKALPEKDFKGRFVNNILKEVSINIFDDNCYAFQPLYKLDKETLKLWKDKVKEFVEKGNVKVYAENALNEVTDSINIVGMSYSEDYIDEIDNEDDYNRVSNDIKYFDYKEQKIIEGNYQDILKKHITKEDKLFIVCGKTLKEKIEKDIKEITSNYTFFNEFTPNPNYEDIRKGLDLFKKDNYTKIISIGGGSSIDTAKTIKALFKEEKELDFLNKKYDFNNIYHIAIPTTSGTGSESTTTAVIYYKGNKVSVDSGFLLPELVILDYNFLLTLPDYQKKSTLLDSLCQAIESFWSKSSTKESREYSKKCINLILNNYKEFLNNDNESSKDMLKASNLSGKAINITRTTAPHAMSYKLTSTYKISHGHAVAISLIPVWKKLLNNEKQKGTLLELAKIFNKESIDESIKYVEDMINSFNLEKIEITEEKAKELSSTVDLERLSNHPEKLTKDDLYELYLNI